MRHLLILAFCMAGLCAQAQNVALTEVNIGVVCPEEMEGISTSELNKLRHKVEQIAASNGISTYADGEFVMYPVFDIYDHQTVEGGMKNIDVVKVEMTLYIRQMSSSMIVNSVAISLMGRGYGRSSALVNAISSVNPKDPAYGDFLKTGKTRIYTYFEENGPKLIAKAKALAAQQNYEEALAILASYPQSLSSYETKISPIIITIYNQYQSNMCAKLIQEAKGYIALKDFASAVNALFQIDPESQCKSECAQLQESIKQQVSKEEAEAIEREFKVFNTLADLEKHRINAARDVAKAYYSNQPAINYTQIVK